MEALIAGVVIILSLWFAVGVLSFIFSLIVRIFKRTSEFEEPDLRGEPQNFSGDNRSYNPPDSFEGWFYEARQPRNTNATLRFHYQDGNRNKTERTVRVRQYDDKLYGGIIFGHCFLRDANRTFRFDRISNCIDVESGEIISDIRAHMRSEYAQSREYTLDNLVEDNRDLLRVLLYMVKADGQFRAAEKSVVAKYLRELSGDSRLDEQSIANLLTEFSIPTEHAFKIAVGKLLQSGGIEPYTLRRCCQKIVDTQKTVHPMEQRALDYIDKKMPRKAVADIEL